MGKIIVDFASKQETMCGYVLLVSAVIVLAYAKVADIGSFMTSVVLIVGILLVSMIIGFFTGRKVDMEQAEAVLHTKERRRNC